MVRLLFLLLCLALSVVAPAQSSRSKAPVSLLRSGPMVGFSDMKETWLWVQTTAPATAQIAYREAGTTGEWQLTDPVPTTKDKALTARLIADQVQPGKVYDYRLRLNGREVALPYRCQFQTQALWQHRTDPPAFRVAIGSCAYINERATDRPGKPYGGDSTIFLRIADKRPDLMLWLGDNTYMREPDWHTRTGIWHRYSHTRAVPTLQPLLASAHHYAVWDDHDYGPNDADRSFANKDLALEAFNLFWLNPQVNGTGQGGVTGTFTWNDVQFFLLDDRWFRAPNNDPDPNRPYLGEAQLQWLADQLRASKATFKIICNGGQMLNLAARHDDSYIPFTGEHARFIKLLEDVRIPGIFLLSGDRHHTVLTKMERPGSYPLYDLTCSSLTAGSYAPRESEKNERMVPNTLVVENNFGILEFGGTRKARTLTAIIYDKTGGEKWRQTFQLSELGGR